MHVAGVRVRCGPLTCRVVDRTGALDRQIASVEAFCPRVLVAPTDRACLNGAHWGRRPAVEGDRRDAGGYGPRTFAAAVRAETESVAVPVRLLPRTTALIGSNTGELPQDGARPGSLIPGTSEPFAGRELNAELPEGHSASRCWKFSTSRGVPEAHASRKARISGHILADLLNRVICYRIALSDDGQAGSGRSERQSSRFGTSHDLTAGTRSYDRSIKST